MIFRKASGIRLERKKDASLLNWNLKRPNAPEKIRISIPPGSLPCVRAGEKVVTGQKIAEPGGPEGVSVHAGMSGTVERIADFPDASGKESLMIEIRRQGEPKTAPPAETRKGWTEIPAEKLHLLEYGFLGYLVFKVMSNVRSRMKQYLYAALIVGVIGIGDELIQKLLPNRVCDVKDMALNFISGILGLALIEILNNRKART